MLFLTVIICSMIAPSCFGQLSNATYNHSLPFNMWMNTSGMTNATIIHNLSTNDTFLILPVNGTNITAIQHTFGNSTPQYIQNNTAILIPLNTTVFPNVTANLPALGIHYIDVTGPNRTQYTLNGPMPTNQYPAPPAYRPTGTNGGHSSPPRNSNDSHNQNSKTGNTGAVMSPFSFVSILALQILAVFFVSH